jgi:hypothetical protein
MSVWLAFKNSMSHVMYTFFLAQLMVLVLYCLYGVKISLFICFCYTTEVLFLKI